MFVCFLTDPIILFGSKYNCVGAVHFCKHAIKASIKNSSQLLREVAWQDIHTDTVFSLCLQLFIDRLPVCFSYNQYFRSVDRVSQTHYF